MQRLPAIDLAVLVVYLAAVVGYASHLYKDGILFRP